MLRRVVRVLRWSLLAIGVLLLACTPVTFLYVAVIGYEGSSFGAALVAKDGALWFLEYPGTSVEVFRRGMHGRFQPNPSAEYWHALVPTHEAYIGHVLTIPLWLLAFICLAWPVTSFIIARKRQGRGFEVEPAGTSNIQHPTSNIEAP